MFSFKRKRSLRVQQIAQFSIYISMGSNLKKNILQINHIISHWIDKQVKI